MSRSARETQIEVQKAIKKVNESLSRGRNSKVRDLPLQRSKVAREYVDGVTYSQMPSAIHQSKPTPKKTQIEVYPSHKLS